jgi:CGNR zinc finger
MATKRYTPAYWAKHAEAISAAQRLFESLEPKAKRTFHQDLRAAVREHLRLGPDAGLAHVIERLEKEEARENSLGLSLLALAGPLYLDGAYRVIQSLSDDDIRRIRGELLTFLRGIVRAASKNSFASPMHVTGDVSVGLEPSGKAVSLVRGQLRDQLLMQLIVKLHQVGLRSVRGCGAPDCSRLFVKRYRREYCSARCQKRINTRTNRQRERARLQQQVERRARRRQERLSN